MLDTRDYQSSTVNLCGQPTFLASLWSAAFNNSNSRLHKLWWKIPKNSPFVSSGYFMKSLHNLFPVSFFALQSVRQRSVVFVVKIFACVGTTYRDWLERQEKIFPLRRKPTFVFGFSLLKIHFSTTLNRGRHEQRTKITIRVFSSLRLRCCCSVHTLCIFSIVMMMQARYISRGFVFELESRQIFTSEKWNISTSKCS
jgi:hypothetical protein